MTLTGPTAPSLGVLDAPTQAMAAGDLSDKDAIDGGGSSFKMLDSHRQISRASQSVAGFLSSSCTTDARFLHEPVGVDAL